MKNLILIALLAATPAAAETFYETNPTYTDPVDDQATWTIRAPADEGLDQTMLDKAADAFAALPYSFSLLVIRHDTLAFERYFHGSSRHASNNIHSASKSILSALVGIATDKKILAGPDQPLNELLPAAPPPLRLRHLLTMSAGIQWKEDETEYTLEDEPNWVNAILKLPFPDAPGTKFNYSTGLTHLMSAALTRATGMSTASFAQKFLFTPLGIAPEHWGRDPQGINSGGYNLYLTPRELAKFGMLYLHGGNWHGKQLVPRPWVDASFTPKIHAHDAFDYGYNWYLTKYDGYDVKFAWGYGGQFAYVVPALDMVVVMTTNTRDFDPNFEGKDLLEQFVLKAVTGKKTARARAHPARQTPAVSSGLRQF